MKNSAAAVVARRSGLAANALGRVIKTCVAGHAL